MNAEIITIGDEILIGQIVDTNSAWIAEELGKAGIAVTQMSSISDTRWHIRQALDQARERAGLIVMTGGLGPTLDDITKKTLAEYFDTELKLDPEVLADITSLFEKFGKSVSPLNRKQAEVPAECQVLRNSIGTAPGMWFEHHKTIFVSLPGVPYEMKHLMRERVLPKILKSVRLPHILHRTVMTFGLPESTLAERLEGWEGQLPKELKLAYLPNPRHIRLRLSAKGFDPKKLEALIEEQVAQLKQVVGKYVFADGESTMEEALGLLLREKGQTVGTAESCTGGTVSSLLTSVPGSSDYFRGSVVAYHNSIKEELLGVSPATLKAHGAVSQQVAQEMAQGALALLKTDYAIATTGVAGPGGGSPEKPVGLVWVAVAWQGGCLAHEYRMGNDRGRNITRTAVAALNLLRLKILGQE